MFEIKIQMGLLKVNKTFVTTAASVKPKCTSEKIGIKKLNGPFTVWSIKNEPDQ